MKINEKLKKWLTPKKVGIAIGAALFVGYSNQKRKNKLLREENKKLLGVVENQGYQIKGLTRTNNNLNYQLGKLSSNR